jgi:uncharacterized tellurite resistance protein B-like protein
MNPFDPFTRDEAQQVARALAAVAAADGAVLAAEANFIDEFVVLHGVGAHAHVADPLDEQLLARTVRDDDKRREVLRLCLQMALSDRDYAPEEMEMVQRIGEALDVPREETLLMTARVRDELHARSHR